MNDWNLEGTPLTPRQLDTLRRLAKAQGGRLTASEVAGRLNVKVDPALLNAGPEVRPSSLVGRGLVRVDPPHGRGQPTYRITAKGRKALES